MTVGVDPDAITSSPRRMTSFCGFSLLPQESVDAISAAPDSASKRRPRVWNTIRMSPAGLYEAGFDAYSTLKWDATTGQCWPLLIISQAEILRAGAGLFPFATTIDATTPIRSRRVKLESGQGHAIRSRDSSLGRDRTAQLSSRVRDRQLRNRRARRARGRDRVEQGRQGCGAAYHSVRGEHRPARSEARHQHEPEHTARGAH